MMKISKKNRSGMSGVNAVDWLIFLAVAGVSFLLFCHTDILVTANHSYAYLDGHLKDFYSACFSMNESYSANYLPTSFLIFAIWNIPLKLLGLGPGFWADWNLVFIWWNKLLPTLVYLICGMLVENLCEETFFMGKNKARLAGFAFLAMPVGFFSQFMFCQYDVFTVFFMLCGLKYFFRENSRKNTFMCLLCFGMACTLKYFAILALIVLIFLKEKNVWKILAGIASALLPAIVMCGFYMITDRAAFTNCVLGFGVLEYTQVSAIDIGFASIRLLIVSVCLIAAAAYFTVCRSKKEMISYAVYYCCGMYCALFCFMTWHPQWLLIATVFWVIGIFINDNYKILLWVELLLGVVFTVFVVIAFKNKVDQSLLRNGLFSYLIQYNVRSSHNLANMFRFVDKNAAFSVLAVIMAVFFFFNHPRYHAADFSFPVSDAKGLIRACFLAGSLVFIVPCLRLVPKLLTVSELLWNQGEFREDLEVREETLTREETISQYAVIPGDRINRIRIYTRCRDDGMEAQSLVMTVYDDETGKVVGKSVLAGDKINRDGLSTFRFENCGIVSGNRFRITVTAEYGAMIPVRVCYGASDLTTADYYRTVKQDYDSDYIEVRGKRYCADRYHMVSVIEGLYKKPHYGLY